VTEGYVPRYSFYTWTLLLMGILYKYMYIYMYEYDDDDGFLTSGMDM